MKIIKRDGRVVEYDKSKIEKAIGKANAEVRPLQRVNKEQIADIIAYIEGLGKNKMQVEDVQDIIEKKLVELGKFELAKKYIIYRYTRALIRKANTTDESILGLIKNSNKDVMEILGKYGEAPKSNMQALTKRYGPAPQAYFIVPLVGSLFIDFCNGIIITGFMNILPMFG